MRHRTSLGLIMLGTLVLTACSTGNSSSAAGDSEASASGNAAHQSVVSPSGSVESESDSGVATPNPAPAGGTSSGNRDSSGGNSSGETAASDNKVGGVCGTIQDATVVAGPKTYCGIAMEVARLATAGTHPQAYWPVIATSPATGKTYEMSCGVAGDARDVGCWDLNGTAEVQVTTDTPGYWSHLVRH